MLHVEEEQKSEICLPIYFLIFRNLKYLLLWSFLFVYSTWTSEANVSVWETNLMMYLIKKIKLNILLKTEACHVWEKELNTLSSQPLVL